MTKYNNTLFLVVITARIFDILTTYIAGNGDLSGEMNILVRILGLGWSSLLLSEVVVVLVAYFILKKQTEIFYIEAEQKIKNKDVFFNEYLGMLYFGKKISFFKSLFSKINYKVVLNSFIHLFLITLIIVSFLIAINNLLSRNYLNLYSFQNDIFIKNIPNILNIVSFTFIVIIYHYRRYKKYKHDRK